MQNCLSRVVTKSPRFSHSAPHLKSLHWLPIPHRIIFKICTITYEALSSGQPAYLHSLLTPTRKARQFRSSTSHLVCIPRIKKNIVSRAFSIAAPTLWNSLPVSDKSCEDISTFRRHLKTYLFDLAYRP